VLDIGSNSGIIDILLAVRYQPKLIIGIDIDHTLVKQAIDNM
jgi:tRNA1(Val) A37 N6-methylase TrmN6